MSERISGLRRLGYGLGIAGYQITDRVVIAIAIYYYLPPAGRGLVPQVSQERMLEFFTVFGLAMLVGRIFDSLADPLVAHASDRSRSRFGRRRLFLMLGILPMVLVPGLLFWPPGPPGSALNGYSLALVLTLYFIAFTVYVAPYLALIPELAVTGAERTRLSTLLALLAFPVVGLYGAGWPYGVELGVEQFGLSADQAVRAVVVVSLGLAFVLCLLPILALDERRFTRAVSSDLPFLQAVGQTVSSRPFRLYLGAQLFLVLGTAVMTPAPVYYATVVLGRSESFAAWLGLALFASTLIGFGLVGRFSNTLGPKRILITSNAIFALSMFLLAFLKADVPGGPHDAANLRIVWTAFALIGFPVAGFLVIPNVLISQVIDYDAARQGASRAAMFFGVQGFFTKWMYGIAGAILAYLFQRFGNSPQEPLGVLLIGPVAGVACLISAVLFLAYPERQVLSRTAVSPSESAPPDRSA